MIGDRLVRDWERPPCDSLAEALVLNGLMWQPCHIGYTDLTGLLVYPEHRWIWRAMQGVYARDPDTDFADFYIGLIAELEAQHPGEGYRLIALVDDVLEDEARWRWDEYRRDKELHPDRVMRTADYDHGFQWWLARLKDCAEARRLVQAGQEIAERAWRLDLSGAHRAISAVPAGTVIRIDV